MRVDSEMMRDLKERDEKKDKAIRDRDIQILTLQRDLQELEKQNRHLNKVVNFGRMYMKMKDQERERQLRAGERQRKAGERLLRVGKERKKSKAKKKVIQNFTK